MKQESMLEVLALSISKPNAYAVFSQFESDYIPKHGSATDAVIEGRNIDKYMIRRMRVLERYFQRAEYLILKGEK